MDRSAEGSGAGAALGRPVAWPIGLAIGLLAFLVVSGAVSAGYRRLVGVPYIAVLTEKTEDYAAAAGDYDLVFLGSSQTFRHIDPAVVDAQLAQCGVPASSYNFGVPALREPELRYIAEQVLANRSPRLRTVVIQDAIRSDGVFANQMSDRGRYFRGGDRLPDAIHDVSCYTGSRMGLLRRIGNNLRSMSAEQIGLGRLAQLFFSTGEPPTLGYDPRFADRDGFWPADLDEIEMAKAPPVPMTDDVLAIAATTGGEVPPGGSAACRAGQLLETVHALEAAGLRVVYFVSPSPRDVAHDRAIAAAMAAAEPDLPILDFNEPAQNPELFDRVLWHDVGHMSGEGAELLSAEIGERLCPIVRGSTPGAGG